MPYTLICTGSITLTEMVSGGRPVQYINTVENVVLPKCSTGWQIIAQTAPFESSQIDPLVVVALVSGGFLLYLTPWAAAYGFSSLLKLLR